LSFGPFEKEYVAGMQQIKNAEHQNGLRPFDIRRLEMNVC